MNFQHYIDAAENSFHVPIDKIDGVNVYVFIEKGFIHHDGSRRNVDTLYFEINYVHSERRKERHCIKNQEEFDKMIEKLKNWRFDKLRDRFVEGKQVTVEFYDCLVCPTVKFTFEECCVCLEKTNGETCCNHPLCLSCLTNLKKPKCPLCRANIESEESDDE